MRPLPWIAISLLSLLVAAPADGQARLRWDECGPAGPSLKVFQCDTEEGEARLVVSVVPPVVMPYFNGFSVWIRLDTDGSSLSPWWHLESGGCRSGTTPSAFAATFDSSAHTTACLDPWKGPTFGGPNWQSDYYGTGTARIRAVGAITGTVAIAPPDEYHLVTFRIRYPKTTGELACSGCDQAVCMQISDLLLVQPLGVGDYRAYVVDTPPASWRCVGLEFTDILRVCEFGGCTTATRTPTWGAVKGLYR